MRNEGWQLENCIQCIAIHMAQSSSENFAVILLAWSTCLKFVLSFEPSYEKTQKIQVFMFIYTVISQP